jgi:hypothetical protein
MTDSAAIRQNIEIVEEAYEFMLAYAAQGRAEEGAGPDGAHIRTFLERFAEAAGAMRPQAEALMAGGKSDGGALLDSFQRDSDTVLSVLHLLLGRDNISSEMIDNTNGLIVMRSYLTTLFFIDKSIIADGD